LPPYERAGLELLVAPIIRLLHLVDIDVSPASEAEEDAEGERVARRKYVGSLTDLVRAGLLVDGQEVFFTWTGVERSARISVDNGEAAIIVDGVRHKTPSGAGAAIRNGAVNGWSYWATRDADGDLITLGELRARLPEAAA
jgi:hypothetical protein